MSFFQEQFVLTESEADMHRRIKLSALLRRMQDIAGHHIESLGMPRDLLIARGQVFLLSKVEATILRSPEAGETITVETRPHPASGVYFLRETRFLSESGETLVTAASAWILADPNTHQVLRPNLFDWGSYVFAEADFDPSVARRRLALPEDLQDLGERVIRYTDLDVNGHVNNAVYGDILCDFVPAHLLERPIRRFTIHYEHEARLGETLSLQGAPSDGGYTVVGKRDGKRGFSAQIRLD